MRRLIFPDTEIIDPQTYGRAKQILAAAGLNLRAWRRDGLDKSQKTIIKNVFANIEKSPFWLVSCDSVEMIESLYETLPITWTLNFLQSANSFATHDFVDPFDRGDFESDNTRFIDELTSFYFMLWIYPTTRYRNFNFYESRIFNILTDRLVSKKPTVFLVHYPESLLKDMSNVSVVLSSIRDAVGANVANLIKTETQIFEVFADRKNLQEIFKLDY